MRANLEYNQFLIDMTEELEKIGDDFNEAKKDALKKLGKSIKKEVELELKKFKTDKTAEKYKHMCEDVTYKVVDDKSGNAYVVVMGGKKTAYKWHLVDDGTSKTNPRHFTEKAMKEAKPIIAEIINELLREVSKSGD